MQITYFQRHKENARGRQVDKKGFAAVEVGSRGCVGQAGGEGGLVKGGKEIEKIKKMTLRALSLCRSESIFLRGFSPAKN